MSGRHALLHRIPEQARARIRLQGSDALRLLQGTLSADLSNATGAQAAALLTVKGKLVSDAIVLPITLPEADARPPGDAAFDLLVPQGVATEIHGLLDRHIIMDDVQLSDPVEGALAFVWDLAEEALLEDLVRVQAFATRYPAPGHLLWSDDPHALHRVLETLGTEEVSVDAWNRYRVQTGTPAWGHELAPGLFPPEAGFVFAVSYDKGCYLGQEPLARIHARGQVQRVMVRVAGAQPIPTPTALHHEEREDAGTLTTFVPAETGGFVGLAIVRRSFASSGTALRALVNAQAVEILVASGPLGDDPGVGQKRQQTVRLGGP